MNVQSSFTVRETSGDNAPLKPLTWLGCGVAEGWLGSRLEPICRQFPHLIRGAAPQSLRALEQGEGNWDILFLGAPDNASPLAVLVSRISRMRPLNCIVAVAPSLTPGDQIDLLRAGACDVLGVGAEADQIFHTVDRLQELILARRRFWEKEMLRLVGQLAISVNHEINNPLTGLMGTAELMLMDDHKLDDKMRRDLQTIITQCHRIQEVTARLKNLKQLRTVPYGSHDSMIDLIGDLQPAPVSQPTQPADQFLPAPRVLVVDDNPLIIDLIARLFEQRFAIDAAGCASEAMAKIERNSYDLVLIDLILPEMNGLELFRAIRRLRPRQKAMLTTAYEGDARVEQAIAEGAQGCIYKPFQLEDLEKALIEALKFRESF